MAAAELTGSGKPRPGNLCYSFDMLPVLTKPAALITAADIEQLIGWPETAALEFKVALSDRSGREGEWARNGVLTDLAKERLFKEVVALANAQGGHLFVGVAQSEDNPPRATEIHPIPKVGDLAVRLEQAASSGIEPPIPNLIVQSVEFTGGAGVLMLRVPQSRDAPHRAPDLHCYVRRGINSEPMMMREVQNMMLRLASRGDQLEREISALQARFRTFIDRCNHAWTGFQISCVPVGGPIDIDRVYNKPGLGRWVRNLPIKSGMKDVLIAPHEPTDQRPILGGARWLTSSGRGIAEKVIERDGKVTFAMATPPRESGEREIYRDWVLGSMVNALVAVDACRRCAGVPETEYAIELAIGSHMTAIEGPTIVIESTWKEGSPLPRPTVTFPRQSFGRVEDLSDLISATNQDILDCIGVGRVDAQRIELDFPSA